MARAKKSLGIKLAFVVATALAAGGGFFMAGAGGDRAMEGSAKSSLDSVVPKIPSNSMRIKPASGSIEDWAMKRKGDDSGFGSAVGSQMTFSSPSHDSVLGAGKPSFKPEADSKAGASVVNQRVSLNAFGAQDYKNPESEAPDRKESAQAAANEPIPRGFKEVQTWIARNTPAIEQQKVSDLKEGDSGALLSFSTDKRQGRATGEKEFAPPPTSVAIVEMPESEKTSDPLPVGFDQVKAWIGRHTPVTAAQSQSSEPVAMPEAPTSAQARASISPSPARQEAALAILEPVPQGFNQVKAWIERNTPKNVGVASSNASMGKAAEPPFKASPMASKARENTPLAPAPLARGEAPAWQAEPSLNPKEPSGDALSQSPEWGAAKLAFGGMLVLLGMVAMGIKRAQGKAAPDAEKAELDKLLDVSAQEPWIEQESLGIKTPQP